MDDAIQLADVIWQLRDCACRRPHPPWWGRCGVSEMLIRLLSLGVAGDRCGMMGCRTAATSVALAENLIRAVQAAC